MDTPVLSVGQYLEYINNVLREYVARDIIVEGEITGFTIKDSKWIIFELKDEQDPKAKVKCFATTFRIRELFEDGMRVRVVGSPAVKGWSTFQIDVQEIRPVGEGALKKSYELLKRKLEAEGLFDSARKRTLPRFPKRIGLITSRDAAAYGDFLRILNNRWGGVVVDFYHVHVQGQLAAEEIRGAFRYVNALPEDDRPDLVVLTRGGGSLEDLHAFNEEEVARAVYGSQIPVVCAVGHERDESLCDFVADVRASTPSNAAERVVPRREDVRYEIETMTGRMEDRLFGHLREYTRKVERAAQTIGFVLERQKERFGSLLDLLLAQVDGWIPPLRDRVMGAERFFKQVDPKRILARGYSIVRSGKQVVKDASMLELGADVEVQLARGSFEAKVLQKGSSHQQKLV